MMDVLIKYGLAEFTLLLYNQNLLFFLEHVRSTYVVKKYD
jgi:hypothetical protein